MPETRECPYCLSEVYLEDHPPSREVGDMLYFFCDEDCVREYFDERVEE